MAWSSPRTWNPGETVTAAMMNAHVRDNLNILKTPITDAGKIQPINSTYFSDLDGNNLLITALPFIARQTSDVTKNANTTKADLPGLAFAVEASKTYHFDACLFIISSTTADIKLALTGPASPTAVLYQVSGDAGGSAAAMATAFGSNVVTGGRASFAQIVRLVGTIRNGSNPGTVQVQGAQNVSDASNTIFYTDSFLTVHKS